MFHHYMIVVLLAAAHALYASGAAHALHVSEATPEGGAWATEWGQNAPAAERVRRQAQGFGGQGFGGVPAGLRGGNGGYGVQNWYNTPEGWGYDATYPGGETHFHAKRGGGGQGGVGGRGGSY